MGRFELDAAGGGGVEIRRARIDVRGLAVEFHGGIDRPERRLLPHGIAERECARATWRVDRAGAFEAQIDDGRASGWSAVGMSCQSVPPSVDRVHPASVS